MFMILTACGGKSSESNLRMMYVRHDAAVLPGSSQHTHQVAVEAGAGLMEPTESTE